MSELPGSGSPTTQALIQFLEEQEAFTRKSATLHMSGSHGRGVLEADAAKFRAAADALRSLHAALEKINTIRSSIVGLQALNWSEHVYPLVAALDEAGYVGMSYPEAQPYFGTMLERTLAAEAEVARLTQARNSAPDEGGHDLWSRVYNAVANDGVILHDDTVSTIERAVREWAAEGALKPVEPALETVLELNGTRPAPLRVAAFLRHYAMIIRRNEWWDTPETMARAYESGAAVLEHYESEVAQARDALEQERDEAVSRIPTEEKTGVRGGLVLNAYGRKCYHAGLEAGAEAGPLPPTHIDNGNSFIFCDVVDTSQPAGPLGCVRGAGHNGPHAFSAGARLLMPVLLRETERTS